MKRMVKKIRYELRLTRDSQRWPFLLALAILVALFAIIWAFGDRVGFE